MESWAWILLALVVVGAVVGALFGTGVIKIGATKVTYPGCPLNPLVGHPVDGTLFVPSKLAHTGMCAALDVFPGKGQWTTYKSVPVSGAQPVANCASACASDSQCKSAYYAQGASTFAQIGLTDPPASGTYCGLSTQTAEDVVRLSSTASPNAYVITRLAPTSV